MERSNIIEPLSVDSVILGFEDDELKVLLVKRAIEPAIGKWALPGGFIKYDETIDKAAERVLLERTGVNVYMEQLGAFGELERFPGNRVITIAYYALVKPGNFTLSVGNDSSDINWFNVYNLPDLPFDHEMLIMEALDRLRKKVRIEPIGFNLLPNSFPLYTLQKLYEAILNVTFDKPNFRRKILRMKILLPLEKMQEGVAHRSARLFKFDKENYDRMRKKGFNFEL